MNKKQWIALLVVYVTYLLFGAGVFFIIETKLEAQRRSEKYFLYRNITDYLKQHFPNLQNDTEEGQFVQELQSYCGKPILPDQSIDDAFPILWDFYNSFFFVVTVVSTIGYGNLAPTSAVGRILMIFYAIVGIPLNGILLTQLGQFFSSVFVRAHHKYKEQKHYETKCSLAIDIIIYLIPGIIVFIFLPAGAFMYFENWPFDVAVYYAFVTLTTIGFGDFVAGQTVSHKNGVFWTYKVLLLCWIIFGLGYLIMLLGFVTRAMRSKKIVRMEQKLVDSVVHSKFWNGFAKDIGYLRRIVNEIYLDKFKPVFKEEPIKPLLRSKSLPNIHINTDKEQSYGDGIIYQRRRANSEFVPSINRVFSETDLERIDRKATFSSAALMQRADFLKEVANALEDTLNRTEDNRRMRGIDIFPEDEVLRSERRGGGWEIGGEKFSPPPYEKAVGSGCGRHRAASEVTIPSTMLLNVNNGQSAEWTWTGAASNMIHKLNRENKDRNSPDLGKKENKRLSMFYPSKLVRGKKRIMSESTDQHSANYLNVPGAKFRKRHSLQINEEGLTYGKQESHYLTHTGTGGSSGLAYRPIRRGSDFPINKRSDSKVEILEETSLGDLLRILTSIHARLPDTDDLSPGGKTSNAGLGSSFDSEPALNILPSCRPQDNRKFSLRTTLFTQPQCTTNKAQPDEEKPATEQSNLKRLGRFLLRRYSKSTPPDVMIDEEKSIKSSKSRKFSLWPNEMYSSFKNDTATSSTIDEPTVKLVIDDETMKTNTTATVNMNPNITITPAPEDRLPSNNIKWRVHQLRTEEDTRRPSLPNLPRNPPG